MNNIKELVKSTNELSESLNDKNHELFTNITCYLRASSLSEKECEESIQEILDMFLTAEANKESVENIIGNNPKDFCDEIIQSYDTKKFSNENIICNLKIILNGFLILWTIDIVFDYIPNMIKSKSLLLNYNFSLAFIINTLLIIFLSFAVFKYIGKTSFKKEKNHMTFATFDIKFLLTYIIFLTITILIYRKLNTMILFTTKIHYIVLFIAIIYFIIFIYEKHIFLHK